MTRKQIEHFVQFFNENRNYLSFEYAAIQAPLTVENFEEYFVSLDNIIQLIREDLSVVEGDIEALIENFVQMPMDKFKLMKNPNIVD
jgi:hypothetical protein